MTNSDDSRIDPPIETKPFDRRFWDGADTFTKIGISAVGGRASGLVHVRNILARRFQSKRFPSLELNIPTLIVITTEFYDRFMQENNLYGEVLREYRDDQIALIFQRGELAPELVGDLRALISHVHTPLAIRSSSLLEDAMQEPFAGVYGTKMIPNNQPETNIRFNDWLRRLSLFMPRHTFKSPQLSEIDSETTLGREDGCDYAGGRGQTT